MQHLSLTKYTICLVTFLCFSISCSPEIKETTQEPDAELELLRQIIEEESDTTVLNQDVKMTDEMKDFITFFNGDNSKSAEGLVKHSDLENIINNDILYYSFNMPSVEREENDCYKMKFESETVVDVYKICWSESKIISLEKVDEIF